MVNEEGDLEAAIVNEDPAGMMVAGLVLFWQPIATMIQRGYDMLGTEHKKLLLGWIEELVTELRKELPNDEEANSSGSVSP